jgi:hypothetical protein
MFRQTRHFSGPCWVPLTMGLLLVLGISGCATHARGVAFSQSVSPPPGHALLYVFRRDAQPTAWGATVRVSDENVATLNQGGFTWVYVQSGKRQVRAAWPILSGQRDSYIELELAEGSTHYVELVGVSKAAGVSGPYMIFQIGSGLNEISPESAQAEMTQCCVLQPAAKTMY